MLNLPAPAPPSLLRRVAERLADRLAVRIAEQILLRRNTRSTAKGGW